MNYKTVLTIVFAVLALTVVVLFIQVEQGFYAPKGVDGQRATSSAQSGGEIDRPELSGPEGWEEYWNDQWRMAFAYPQTWELTPVTDPRGNITSVALSGDGYELILGRGAGGLPDRTWVQTTTTLDSLETKVWEYVTDLGSYEIVLQAGSYRIHVTQTPRDSREVVDKIISTISIY